MTDGIIKFCRIYWILHTVDCDDLPKYDLLLTNQKLGTSPKPRLNLKTVKFSSAGCQTLPGGYDSENTKPLPGYSWFDFRKALGLNNKNPTKDNGKKFVYTLLTGREARLITHGVDSAKWTRLRFGSKGKDVEALQQMLGQAGLYKGKIDGDMGPNTAWAYIQWQKKNDQGTAGGIVNPTTARQLGFDIIARQSIQKGVSYGMGVQPWNRYFPFIKGTKFEIDGKFG